MSSMVSRIENSRVQCTVGGDVASSIGVRAPSGFHEINPSLHSSRAFRVVECFEH
jgi:hypothetical protein